LPQRAILHRDLDARSGRRRFEAHETVCCVIKTGAVGAVIDAKVRPRDQRQYQVFCADRFARLRVHKRQFDKRGVLRVGNVVGQVVAFDLAAVGHAQ